MTGWLVNDRLTAIPGTRTLWHHLLDGIPGLIDHTHEPYSELAALVEKDCLWEPPDYIIRNAAYFRKLFVHAPTISFVQDILHGPAREILVEACEASRLLVFNSEYTRAAYPELHAAAYRVIPIGIDESIFKPQGVSEPIPDGAVLWVGSGHSVKGFQLACKLASESKRPWVFVMKDDTEVPVSRFVYRRVTQERLASIASSCAVGVCTSEEETQHLAGIEMGFCGLPILATDVGVYHAREPGAWGKVIDTDWHCEIEILAAYPRPEVVGYWHAEGFGLVACLDRWSRAVVSLEGAHVLR